MLHKQLFQLGDCGSPLLRQLVNQQIVCESIPLWSGEHAGCMEEDKGAQLHFNPGK